MSTLTFIDDTPQIAITSCITAFFDSINKYKICEVLLGEQISSTTAD